MFVLQSEIKIGACRFTRVAETEVMRSVHSLGATARVTLPVSAVLKGQGGVLGQQDTAQAVSEGDAVEIRLGYGRELNTEFKGYVRKVSKGTPVIIECEDEFYSTRSREVSFSGDAVKLADLLQQCGLNVGEAADMELRNFVADNETVSGVLRRIAAECGLNVFFDTEGKVYAVDAGYRTQTVKYALRRNLIRAESMELTAFLLPHAEPCMAAEVTDDAYGERNGRFIIEAVRTTFGRQGGRRHISLGKEV
ncbi:MAG: hypothetical protein NC396_08125 [Bacteroides sp.]|nr:hypothetical protein [Bacteroides sp.]MCM1086303.1 hypothetical protein [Bacteroides sp.]